MSNLYVGLVGVCIGGVIEGIILLLNAENLTTWLTSLGDTNNEWFSPTGLRVTGAMISAVAIVLLFFLLSEF